MKIINGFILLLLAVTIFYGCGKSEEAISNKYLDNLSVTLSDQPTSKDSEHSYEVTLKNNENELVNVDSVEIILKMKSMNHKEDGKLKKVSKGVYKGKVKLPMDGLWDKTIVLKQEKFVRKVSGATLKQK
ncbi:FixH family protein [Gottfriedia acidiceleris]|uniref:FixH family protein n=1 Tax=Gottfriedia acidiceleris TaxID=371036 RepID=UPI000B44D76A|nr:FixH family protein [Gottfriedia acidiceleris]